MFLDKTQKAEAAGQQRLRPGRERRSREGDSRTSGWTAGSAAQLGPRAAVQPRPGATAPSALLLSLELGNSPFSLTPQKGQATQNTFLIDSSCPRPPDAAVPPSQECAWGPGVRVALSLFGLWSLSCVCAPCTHTHTHTPTPDAPDCPGAHPHQRVIPVAGMHPSWCHCSLRATQPVMTLGISWD